MREPELDSAGVYFLSREEFEARGDAGAGTRPTATCDECGSSYYTDASEMSSLCPECAHRLYGQANCDHLMISGRCRRCFWDGTVSKFLAAKR